MEWKKSEYTITTDKTKMDVNVVHNFLTGSYWAEGISRAIVQKSINHSMCFGIFNKDSLVGFARVITDKATFAYLADVFVLPNEQKKGLASWLVEVILAHPDLQGLRRIALATRDAHGLYAKFGFRSFDKPDRWMQLHDPHVYKNEEI